MKLWIRTHFVVDSDWLVYVMWIVLRHRSSCRRPHCHSWQFAQAFEFSTCFRLSFSNYALYLFNHHSQFYFYQFISGKFTAACAYLFSLICWKCECAQFNLHFGFLWKLHFFRSFLFLTFLSLINYHFPLNTKYRCGVCVVRFVNC